MPRTVTFILALLAAAGFALSLAAHVAAVAGSPAAMLGGAAWALHLTSIAVVFATMRACRGNRPTGTIGSWPKAARVAFACAFIYAAANLVAVHLSHTPGGRVERRGDGTYAILNGSRLVRQISAGEAQQMWVRSVRAYSGVWTMTHGCCAAALIACLRDPGASRQPPAVADRPGG